MLAFVAVFFIIALITSVLVIAATMLSSRLRHTEEHYLAEKYEVEQNDADAPASETSPSSS